MHHRMAAAAAAAKWLVEEVEAAEAMVVNTSQDHAPPRATKAKKWQQ